MALPTWKCVVCDKKFSVGEWLCRDGVSNHVVENKKYLLNDAPTDPGHPMSGGMDSLRNGCTRICNIPPDRTVLKDGVATMIMGGYVEFVRGIFQSNDPEIQYYLDKKGGWCSEDQWEAAWLSKDQRLNLREMKLNAQQQRLENERNDLLSKVKQQVGA